MQLARTQLAMTANDESVPINQLDAATQSPNPALIFDLFDSQLEENTCDDLRGVQSRGKVFKPWTLTGGDAQTNPWLRPGRRLLGPCNRW
jgi:hypothetical protein